MVYASATTTSPRQKTYDAAYRSILAARRRSPSQAVASVVLLVAPEVDALCAARMLSSLFKQDDVPYRIIPVSGYPGLEEVRNELLERAELCALVLINIGALLDLTSPEWFGEFSPHVNIHVIDSNRPQNLQNLFGQHTEAQRILVWDDGGVTKLEKERESYGVLSHVDVMPQQEPDDDSGSGSEDFSDDDDSNDDEEFGEEEEEPNPSDDELGSEPGHTHKARRRKRRRRNEEGRVTREQRRQHQAVIDKHYNSGRWYGQSAAGTVYVLTTLLKRADNDLLWLSILGLTYQFITSRISRDKYDMFHGMYVDEVARLNPPEESSNHTVDADDTQIRLSEELRFTLFRHWNLYDSMYHSSYVANKLGIWQEKGRKKLQGLLAKMGFSLEQCQQTYQHMNMGLKHRLRQQIDTIAPEYGLVDVAYPSFVRSFGFRSQPLCAADVVESVSALSQAAGGVRLEVEIVGGQGGGEWFGGGRVWDLKRSSAAQSNGAATSSWRAGQPDTGTGDDDILGADGSGSATEQWWIRNFWVAFDALGPDISLVQQALPLSMALQRAIIRQGSSLIDKHAVRTLKSFRLAILKEGPELLTFCHPATLSRLGLWLTDALRDRHVAFQAKQGKRKQLPLVVACLDEKSGSYLVVGVTPTTEFGDVRKNHFGVAFIEAKARSNARTRHGTFDTSVVEVNKEDLTSFLEELQLG
ncbi:CDC45-like protein [Clavulina sp. PMI_390]|nr:CDC45-like protein [Clavulina sp. PMI_390]